MFFAEAKCRLLQNVMYVGCCKQTLGATPPNPCKINGCGKSEPTFTPSVDSAITYKRGLQLSVFYSCNKQFFRKHPYFTILKYCNGNNNHYSSNRSEIKNVKLRKNQLYLTINNMVRLKRKSQTKRKKKITNAVYLIQVDSDGEWDEISFDFEAGTEKIVRLAKWDTTVSKKFTK